MSHMSEQERLADLAELGPNSALYRSKWLALFTNLDSDSLISTEVVESLIDGRIAVAYTSMPLRIGGDVAAGGDENAFVAVRGNRIVKEEGWREKDTTLTADHFERLFIEVGAAKDHEHIYMDDGGIGHAVIDMLRRRGWEIRRVRNETRAIKPEHYGNRGAELWFNVKRLCEERILRLDEASEKLREQIVSRHYKKSGTGGRIFLESKRDAKADGRPSPDRADAFVLAFSGQTLDDFLKQEPDEPVKRSRVRANNTAELQELSDKLAFDELEEPRQISNRRLHNSLSVALGEEQIPDYESYK